MKRITALLLIASLMLTLTGFGIKTKGSFSGGTGTPEDPYRISTAKDLRTLSGLSKKQQQELRKSHFLMTNDIDLENRRFTALFSDYYFQGIFDGGGYTITGLKLDYKKPLLGAGVRYQGLFSAVNEARIQNLTVSRSSLSVDTDSGTLGTLVGNARSSVLENCHVTGSVTVTSNYHAGGIVGNLSKGTVTGCTNAAAVTATGSVGEAGGIAAHSSAELSQCSNAGTVTSQSDAGGIAAVQNAAITDCRNTGTVKAEQNHAGGIAASFGDGALNSQQNDASVTMLRCENAGSVTSGKGDAGGIAARATIGIVRDCKNSAPVTGYGIAGGILAVFLESSFGTPAPLFTLENCVNTGAVATTEVANTNYTGGICGWINSGKTDVMIRGCENSAQVTAMRYAGGIVARFQGISLEVTDCKNTGNLSGYESCGGILAYATPVEEKGCVLRVQDCRNSGDLYVGRASAIGGVLLDSYAGGILGLVKAMENQKPVTLTVENCQSTGALKGEDMAQQFHAHPICPSQNIGE